jgi:hypothetical protein
MSLWIKDTSGKPSSSLTFATSGFIIVAVWLVLSIFAKIGKIDIRPFSGSDAMLFLTPILALYFSRRYTDTKLNNAKDQTTDNSPSQSSGGNDGGPVLDSTTSGGK